MKKTFSQGLKTIMQHSRLSADPFQIEIGPSYGLDMCKNPAWT